MIVFMTMLSNLLAQLITAFVDMNNKKTSCNLRFIKYNELIRIFGERRFATNLISIFSLEKSKNVTYIFILHL